MIPFSINLAIVIIIDLISLLLAFWVYLSDRKNKINQTFFGMAFSVFLWITFSFLFSTSKTASQILFWLKLNFGAVSLSALFAYFFALYFPYEGKRYPILDKILSITWIILFFLSIFTDLIIKDIKFKEWGADIVFGKGGNIFLIISAITLILIVWQLFKKYFNLSKEDKLKIQYLLFGLLFFVLFNIVFNIVYPIISGSSKYYNFGDYSAIILLGFIAYAIVKQNLFGIRVVLTTFLVVIIAILLLVQAVTAIPDWFKFGWQSLVFAVFAYFGYLLVRSVMQEIKRREELQMLYEQVDQLSRAKSEFLSIVSHQLRTPLTAVKGYISMILDKSYGPISSKVETKLENVYQSNEKLISFINDLLNVSRIERGKIELQSEKGNIEEIVVQEIEELKVKAGEKELYLKWEKPKEKIPEILMDAGKIKQVVANLIDNAIKYTEKGGITVSMENLGAKIRIVVSDTGDGMEKDEISRLFESFTRGSAGTHLAHEGLGIGLYIAKKFTELHSGKLWAESEGKGKGSTFYIELPIH